MVVAVPSTVTPTVRGSKGAFVPSREHAEAWGEEATHAFGVGSRRIPTRGAHIAVCLSDVVLRTANVWAGDCYVDTNETCITVSAEQGVTVSPAFKFEKVGTSARLTVLWVR